MFINWIFFILDYLLILMCPDNIKKFLTTYCPVPNQKNYVRTYRIIELRDMSIVEVLYQKSQAGTDRLNF